MKNPLLPLALFAIACTTLRAADIPQTLTVKGNSPKGEFSEQRPDYLHIKEVTVTREGKQRLNFVVTLMGDVPSNPKESISFYFGFDIDSDSATGHIAANSPNFGQDVGFYIYQNQGDSRFKSWSNDVLFKGREREITVSNFKVRGNTVEVSVRSELFSMFDSFKFFVSTKQRIFERGKLINETQVNTTNVTTF